MIRSGGLALGLTALTLLVMHQLLQAAAWPSLDEEPPLAMQPVVPPTDSWLALKAVMEAVPMARDDRLKAALEEEGLPSKRGAWREVADQVEALALVMASPKIVSPARPLVDAHSQPSLLPLLPLARAQLLFGWDWHAGGDTMEAAENMLLVDRLGQRLMNGSQSLLMSAVGLAIQEQALTELQELLSLAHETSLHTLVAKRLPMHAPQPGKFREVLRLECIDNEALLLDPFQTTGAVGHQTWSEALPQMLYDVDATVAQHRKMCRAADAWMAHAPTERGQPPAALPEGISDVMTYNTAGVELLKVVSIEGSVNIADTEREVELQRGVLRLLTAARLYAFTRSGELPSRADDLVPEYLPAIPRDPFTGEALEIASGQIETSRDEQVWVTLPAGTAR